MLRDCDSPRPLEANEEGSVRDEDKETDWEGNKMAPFHHAETYLSPFELGMTELNDPPPVVYFAGRECNSRCAYDMIGTLGIERAKDREILCPSLCAQLKDERLPLAFKHIKREGPPVGTCPNCKGWGPRGYFCRWCKDNQFRYREWEQGTSAVGPMVPDGP